MESREKRPTRLEPLFELPGNRARGGGILAMVLCLLAALGLTAEVFLEIYQGESLCPNEACALAGQYVWIGERGLVSLGACFFWILFGLIFFSRRYPRPWLRALPLLALLGALSFDGLLMGYQVFKIQRLCVICLATAGFLVLIHLAYSLGIRAFMAALAGLAVWASGFLGAAIIKEPSLSTNEAKEFAFYRLKAPQGPEFPKLTLIFSLHCPHCLKVLERLSQMGPQRLNIELASVDTDEAALKRLGIFLREASRSPNPLSLLIALKAAGTDETLPPPSGLLKAAQRTRRFLFNLGLYGIPVLLVEESPERRLILSGEGAILEYLRGLSFEEESRVQAPSER
ncbi:hypothetical protein [Thermosulfuriphilus sp.]